MLVLSLFDYSTNMVKPWAEAGYKCLCLDIDHPQGSTMEGNITKVGADILTWLPPREEIKIVFAFPPCTHLAVSGARWFKSKGLGKLIEALTLFNRAIELSEYVKAPYMIENPVSTVSSYYRKPDHKFQPWQYGDLYTKLTCLWTGNDFKMPEPIFTEIPEKVENLIWKMGPSPDRARKRGITPMGFAVEVFKANK